jgi:hypothetical protein
MVQGPTGCSPGSRPRTRPGNRTLDVAARRRARVWEGARGRDSVKWGVVVAGARAPGRPPAGSRGLPPHAPASWQGAWASGRSSAQRRSAWRPDRSSGTPQSLWPCPSASAARNSHSHRSDSRRWPLSPPKVRRSEALEATRQAMPMHPRGQETAHEWSSMGEEGFDLRNGARGRIRTDDLPITSRSLASAWTRPAPSWLRNGTDFI